MLVLATVCTSSSIAARLRGTGAPVADWNAAVQASAFNNDVTGGATGVREAGESNHYIASTNSNSNLNSISLGHRFSSGGYRQSAASANANTYGSTYRMPGVTSASGADFWSQAGMMGRSTGFTPVPPPSAYARGVGYGFLTQPSKFGSDDNWSRLHDPQLVRFRDDGGGGDVGGADAQPPTEEPQQAAPDGSGSSSIGSQSESGANTPPTPTAQQLRRIVPALAPAGYGLGPGQFSPYSDLNPLSPMARAILKQAAANPRAERAVEFAAPVSPQEMLGRANDPLMPNQLWVPAPPRQSWT